MTICPMEINYKRKQHLSVERIVEMIHDLHGVKLSEGAICSIPQRAGNKATQVALACKSL